MIATVIHFTGGGSAQSSIKWMCMDGSPSAHDIISRAGKKTHLVKYTRSAFHAGYGTIKGASNPNLVTIGIELANHGLLQKIDGKFFYTQSKQLHPYRRKMAPVFARLQYKDKHIDGWWEPYPDEQIAALQKLITRIEGLGYVDAAKNLVGHEELDPDRKKDPGPLFPWAEFYRTTPRATRGLLCLS